MRTREEILTDSTYKGLGTVDQQIEHNTRLCLEVLLDIRTLLSPPSPVVGNVITEDEMNNLKDKVLNVFVDKP